MQIRIRFLKCRRNQNQKIFLHTRNCLWQSYFRSLQKIITSFCCFTVRGLHSAVVKKTADRLKDCGFKTDQKCQERASGLKHHKYLCRNPTKLTLFNRYPEEKYEKNCNVDLMLTYKQKIEFMAFSLIRGQGMNCHAINRLFHDFFGTMV